MAFGSNVGADPRQRVGASCASGARFACLDAMRNRLTSIPLTREELSQLHQWARDNRVRESLALRARIVLACQRERPQSEIARELNVTAQTVGKWCARFAELRLAGLSDRRRSGAPRLIGDTLVLAVVTKTLHERPRSSRRWTSRALAQELGLSRSAVLRIWRVFGITPTRFPD